MDPNAALTKTMAPALKPSTSPRPVYMKRRDAVAAKNNEFFIRARENDGRISPTQWSQPPSPNVNTSDKEKPVARHAGRMGAPPQMRTRPAVIAANGERKVVAMDRTTGVTSYDRAATRRENDKFLDAAKSQAVIEKGRR